MFQWSERQMRVAVAWLDLQWNQPSRSDGYVMRLTHEVRHLMAKKVPAFNSKDYTLHYDSGAKSEGKCLPTKDSYTMASKSVWVGRVGGKVRHVTTILEPAASFGEVRK